MPLFAYAKAAQALLAAAQSFSPVVVTPTAVWEVEDGAPASIYIDAKQHLTREVRRVQGGDALTFVALLDVAHCGQAQGELVLKPSSGETIRAIYSTNDGSIAAAIAGKLCRSMKQ